MAEILEFLSRHGPSVLFAAVFVEQIGIPAEPGTACWVGALGATPVLGLASCELFGQPGALDILLADNFTFTSANDDDHISKSAFKARCWESQIDFIERFDVEKVFGEGDEAFVKYLGRTKNGKSFRNVDYFQLKDGKVEAIECYFGGQFGFPSAASTGKR